MPPSRHVSAHESLSLYHGLFGCKLCTCHVRLQSASRRASRPGGIGCRPLRSAATAVACGCLAASSALRHYLVHYSKGSTLSAPPVSQAGIRRAGAVPRAGFQQPDPAAAAILKANSCTIAVPRPCAGRTAEPPCLPPLLRPPHTHWSSACHGRRLVSRHRSARAV